MSKKKHPMFYKHLDKHIKGMLKAGCDVICIQEINKHWSEELGTMLPPRWYSVFDSVMTLCTCYSPSLTRVKTEMLPISRMRSPRKSLGAG